jgi:hypothetical protein
MTILPRIILDARPTARRFIPCANLQTAQLYCGDSTRLSRDAYDAAWETDDTWHGNAAYYVVEADYEHVDKRAIVDMRWN